MNKIIIPASFMGSGSSAITDLISEFENYTAPMGSNELMFLHYPNGVFDLQDKLLMANNALRSDEAIRSFDAAMRELFDTKFWWAGNYKKEVSPNFYEYVKEYEKGLIQYRSDAFWYMQEKPNAVILAKRIINKIVSLITLNKVRLSRPLRYNEMLISFVTEDEFFDVTRSFLFKVFQDMGLNKSNLILDQLFTPFDVHRLAEYFGDINYECFVVDRDPRDVFLLNKYVWKPADTPIPFPVDAREFVRYYKSMRRMEHKVDNVHIHHIHFEDLVYDYEHMVKRIRKILGVSEEQHVRKGKQFNPNRSIENTQLFYECKHNEEVDIIANELRDYLYPFPYSRKANVEKSF